jgi:ketosteroid isomerase-like protein
VSQENVETVRAMIDAGNRRDWDAAFRDAAPDFEWVHTRAVGPDSRGVWTADEAKDYYAAAAELWESVRIEIDELIASGDYVVVPHTMRLRGRDGIEVSVATTWLFTIRGGNIKRVCLYQEKREALEAAGLSK